MIQVRLSCCLRSSLTLFCMLLFINPLVASFRDLGISRETFPIEHNASVFDQLSIAYTKKLLVSDTLETGDRYTFTDPTDFKGRRLRREIKHCLEEKSIKPLVINHINKNIGYGVYAQEDIQKYSCIGEYTGVIEAACESSHATYSWHYPMQNEKNIAQEYCINAMSCGNELRFVNDAGDDSNCTTLEIIGPDGLAHIVFVSLQSIEKGEQVTVDYGQDYWDKKAEAEQIKRDYALLK